jgi:WD40 repeat protein
LLKQPLLLTPNARVVLLFDALDEAGGGSASSISKVLDLVLSIGRIRGGAYLSVVVTTRPDSGILAALRSRWRTNALEFQPSSLRDGNDKLLVLLHNQLPGSAFASVDAAYEVIFDATNSGALNPDVVRLLSILLAARQPPSMAQLEALGVRGACAALPGWGLLFTEQGHCICLLHKTLGEWLIDAARSSRYAVDVTRGHAEWAELLCGEVHAWLESGDPNLAPPKSSYAYSHLLTHLDASERSAEARATLMRLPWLQATLRERGLYALLSDIAARMMNGDDTLSLLHQTLRLAAYGLQDGDAAESLPAQLVGRLGQLVSSSAASPELIQLYDAAYCWRGALEWLRPIRASMQHAGGAVEAQLEAHSERTGSMSTMVMLADGRLLEGSTSATLRVWNVATGECDRMLEGHTKEVTSVVTLTDGRVASGSADGMLRIWNTITGECDCTLKGHAKSVDALVALANGSVMSSDDETLRVWNVATGECVRTLKPRTLQVRPLVALPDGRVVSGSREGTLLAWNIATGGLDAWAGHKRFVTVLLLLLAGGFMVSGSSDGTLRLWNTAAGKCIHSLSRHAGGVNAAVELADGRLVSAGADATLRVWDVNTGESVLTLEGHEGAVTCLAALASGHVVSGAGKKLRLWNVASGECERTLTLRSAVHEVLALADWRVVCLSRHRLTPFLEVCNMAAREELDRPERRHAGAVGSLAAVAGGRVVSASFKDNTPLVWSIATGEFERVLEGHIDGVVSVVPRDDGCVVSISYDRTVRLWNVATSECELSAPRGSPAAEAAMPPRRLQAPVGVERKRYQPEWPGTGHRSIVFAEGALGAVSDYSMRDSGLQIGGPGVAPLYLDVPVSQLLAVPATAAPKGTAHTVLAIGTATGEVHFFAVRPRA